MEHLTPKEAAKFLHDNPKALFIDCRSEMEFLFVGHPAGALHVSWNDGPDWDINPHFVGEVKKFAGHAHDRPVVLICRSGNRSVDAGKALEAVASLTCTTCCMASRANSTTTTIAAR
jgi:rhodanese-related sulfurtransferase